jgi:Skp family chaperone for outer membrane proteins
MTSHSSVRQLLGVACSFMVVAGCASAKPIQQRKQEGCGPLNVGVIDLQKVLQATREGHAARNRLIARRGELSAEQLKLEEQRELKAIFARLDPFVAELSRAQRLQFVLERTDSGVLFFDPRLDRTFELVQMFEGRTEATVCPAEVVVPELRAWFVADGTSSEAARAWVDARGGDLMFAKDASGLVFAPAFTNVTKKLGTPTDPAFVKPPTRTAIVGVVDVSSFNAMPRSLLGTAVRHVAERNGLLLVLDRNELAAVGAGVADITGEVAAVR